MEAGGVEPPSRDVSERASTCIVDRLILVLTASDQQDAARTSPEIFLPDSSRTTEPDQPTDVVRSH